MKKLTPKNLLQKRSLRLKTIYDEYVESLTELRKRHLDEFTSFARKLEQQKIDTIRNSLKSKV
ncbi:hypothetical protein HYV71_00330 [Candidatus Uhrbacteria bacterium]|nr:hypothetical protein [Candidatus Uhrbacteria bacterium]